LKQNKFIGAKTHGLERFYDDISQKGIEYNHYNQFLFFALFSIAFTVKVKKF
jgi:hypothetical protein